MKNCRLSSCLLLILLLLPPFVLGPFPRMAEAAPSFKYPFFGLLKSPSSPHDDVLPGTHRVTIGKWTITGKRKFPLPLNRVCFDFNPIATARYGIDPNFSRVRLLVDQTVVYSAVPHYSHGDGKCDYYPTRKIELEPGQTAEISLVVDVRHTQIIGNRFQPILNVPGTLGAPVPANVLTIGGSVELQAGFLPQTGRGDFLLSNPEPQTVLDFEVTPLDEDIELMMVDFYFGGIDDAGYKPVPSGVIQEITLYEVLPTGEERKIMSREPLSVPLDKRVSFQMRLPLPPDDVVLSRGETSHLRLKALGNPDTTYKPWSVDGRHIEYLGSFCFELLDGFGYGEESGGIIPLVYDFPIQGKLRDVFPDY